MYPALCRMRRGMMCVINLPVADAGRRARPGTAIVPSRGTCRRSRMWTTDAPRPHLSAHSIGYSCSRPLFGTGHSCPVEHLPALSDENFRVRYSFCEPMNRSDLKVPADKMALLSAGQISSLTSKRLSCRARLYNSNPVPKSYFVGRDARQSGT